MGPEGVQDKGETHSLWVRGREAGKVIGRGGEVIKKLIEQTGADVKVQKIDEMADGGREREVQLFGTDEQKQQVLELILKEVTWCRDADGVLKEPPPKPPPPKEEKAPTPRKDEEGRDEDA